MSTLVDLADRVTAVEKRRICIQNQCRSLSEEFGEPGMAEKFDPILLNIMQYEKQTISALEKEVKTHPLWPFFKNVHGCAEKSAGRLLGFLGGDVLTYVNQDDETVERTVSSLWHFAGYAPGKDKKTRGQQISFNPSLRKHLYVIAENFIKLRSPYRDIYDERKASTADRDWTDLHRHRDAIRLMMKEFLRDMYIAATELA